jgi:hypothetical protein
MERAAGPYNPRPPWPETPGGQGKPGSKNEYNLHNEYDSGVSADPAEYMRNWREKWQGTHTDRGNCPDGYGGAMDCSSHETGQSKKAVEKAAATAPSGMYGYTKRTQHDVEVSVRKAQRGVARIAQALWTRDSRSAAFLGLHARRAKSAPARLLLGAMADLGPKVASEEGVARVAAYGLYGHPSRTARLALTACSELREEMGHIAWDLHNRRTAKYEKITGYMNAHVKAAKCGYCRMLLSSYPDDPSGKTAEFNADDIGKTVKGPLENDPPQAWMDGQFTQADNSQLEDLAEGREVAVKSADENAPDPGPEYNVAKPGIEEEIGAETKGPIYEEDPATSTDLKGQFTQKDLHQMLDEVESGKLASTVVDTASVRSLLEWVD